MKKGSSKNAESLKIENPSLDNLNSEKIKINLKNAKMDLASKESKGSSDKNIYLNMEGLNQDERKRKRSSIRRERNRFINQILGKDRSEEERIDSIQKFLIFYKENWKINDFKIENFSQSNNAEDQKDCKNLLDFIKSSME